MTNLHQLLIASAERSPEKVAVRSAGADTTYEALDQLANKIGAAMLEDGVKPGDRIGICLEKSAVGIATMQAALRIGAAYVPLDPLNPPARLRQIVVDAGMRWLIAETDRVADALIAGNTGDVRCATVQSGQSGNRCMADIEQLGGAPLDRAAKDDDLAYVLYTSGSTGRPKGVCISHRNALAFIEWAAHTLDATSDDRFANHAPFHFDLSVLDLYVAFHSGATVVIVSEDVAYDPESLIAFWRREQPTVWYSVPSVLVLMIEQAGLLDHQPETLRVLLFAGEPFPIKQLKRLRAAWPKPRFLNLYGPTETNVCTAYEVPREISHLERPVPIGTAASGDRVWAVTEDGRRAGVGEEGELVVEGPTVLLGYWGKPPHEAPTYRTGDIVRLREDGNYEYIGRHDQMVKVRGSRIELGEIETCLARHPRVREAAAVVVGRGVFAKIVGVLVVDQGKLSLLEVKQHCAEHLPRYMIVDRIACKDALPRNRNGKIDRRRLKAELEEQGR